MRHHPMTGAAQQRQDVAEVVLPLRVVRAHAGQGLEQRLDGERVGAGVHLADLELGRRRVARVLRLDDPLDLTVRASDDAPVLARIVEHARRHGGSRARGGVALGERRDERRLEQRMVA